MNEPIKTRPIMEFVSKIPKEAGELVSMVIYKDKLIVATQFAIFELIGKTFHQLKFKL